MSETRVNFNYQTLPGEANAVSQGTSVTVRKKSNPVKNSFRSIAEFSAWDASADSVGTLFWLMMYYAHLEDNIGAPLPGYITQSVLEGMLSNAVAMPFVYRECLADGDTPTEAWSNIKKYFFMYAFFFDGGFQFVEDTVVNFGKGDYFSNFEFVADPTFEENELLWALAIYVGGYATLNVLLSKVVQKEVSLSEAFKTGVKGFSFYYTDKWFDIDWVSPAETIPEVIKCCSVMWGVSFGLGVAKGLLDKVVDYCRPAEEAGMGILDDDGVEEEVLANEHSAQNTARQGCISRVMSRFSFWCRHTPVAPVDDVIEVPPMRYAVIP